jgi:hypothetical protein
MQSAAINDPKRNTPYIDSDIKRSLQNQGRSLIEINDPKRNTPFTANVLAVLKLTDRS